MREPEETDVDVQVPDVTKDSQDGSSDDLKKPLKDDIVYSYDRDSMLDKIPMRYIRFALPVGGDVYFNWFTSFFGFALLWSLSIWCMVAPEHAFKSLKAANADVTASFTWFYIVANPSFTFFTLWLAYRYGDVKLGKKDEEPEFSDLSYFAMLFSAGVAVGLFYYGVSEPLWHQESHWFAMANYKTQDEKDMFAMMITMYHWGFAGWSPYLVVGIAAGLAAYRFDLPLTVRSCLYHLLGHYTWGWIGDVIDGFSIVMTVGGICTSLGLGAMQLLAGFQRMGWIEAGDPEDPAYIVRSTNINIAIIWVITLIATISVVSGLKVGIQFLSNLGFGLGMVLLFLVLAMENTKFLFNLHVQTIGYYFQWCLFQIPFWTDAFGQLEAGEGRAVDGQAAETWWMDSWTVFYMAWWTAWGAFVGLFLARISRGRTIRQVVIFSLIAPLMYALFWFTTFGGAGLRQARQAMELEALGETYYNDTGHFRVPDSTVCYNVPQSDVSVDGETIFTNTLVGITPVCQLDKSDATAAWFNVMFSFSYPGTDGSFAGFGGFLSVVSMIAIAIYFVTSSDSGSLIVDHLSANGHEEHHALQRVFWAVTEGAVATALLKAGGKSALDALQAASIVFGLPFNVLLFLMMICIVKMCNLAEAEDNDPDAPVDTRSPEEKSFTMPVFGGIFNIFEFLVSFGCVHPERVERGMDKPTMFHVVEFFVGLFFPFWSVFRILNHLGDECYNAVWRVTMTLSYMVLYVGWIVLFALGSINIGFVCIGWCAFFMNACILTTLRLQVRARYDLEGNIIGDFAAASFLYPQALTQMLLQLEEDGSLEEVAA